MHSSTMASAVDPRQTQARGSNGQHMSTLFIVIPAYNEAAVIATTLATLPRRIEGISAITAVVVDDGSADGTVATVRALDNDNVILISHVVNRGLGGALGTGLAYA